MKRRGYLGDFDEVVLPHLDAAYNLARWLRISCEKHFCAR
jgi:hypothetical protein